MVSSAQKWPAVLIGSVLFRYPEHWIDTLRRRTPKTADVTVRSDGRVVTHGTLSRYDELRRFPPVHWRTHAVATVFAVAALATALYNGTPAYLSLADFATFTNGMDWLDRLPSTLSFYALVGLGLFHGICAIVSLIRWRDRQARLANWLDAR